MLAKVEKALGTVQADPNFSTPQDVARFDLSESQLQTSLSLWPLWLMGQKKVRLDLEICSALLDPLGLMMR